MTVRIEFFDDEMNLVAEVTLEMIIADYEASSEGDHSDPSHGDESGGESPDPAM